MPEDKVIDKLRKLIAMEASARSIGNQAEAEAFATKVAALLAEHKLTMSEVEYQAQAKSNPFGYETVSRKGTSSTPVWRLNLARAVARSMFCDYFYSQGRSAITFVGRETDRQAAIALYNSLGDTGKRLAHKEMRLSQKKHNEDKLVILLGTPWVSIHGSEQQWKLSFLLGFTHGVSSRLTVQLDHMLSHSETGLMRRDAIELKSFIELAFPRLSAGRTRSAAPLSGEGYARGKETGATVPLSKSSQLALGKGR